MDNKMHELENLSDDEINDIFITKIEGCEKLPNLFYNGISYFKRDGHDLEEICSYRDLYKYVNRLDVLNTHLNKYDLIRIKKTLDDDSGLYWKVEIFLDDDTGFVHAWALDLGRAIRIALIRADYVIAQKPLDSKDISD